MVDNNVCLGGKLDLMKLARSVTKDMALNTKMDSSLEGIDRVLVGSAVEDAGLAIEKALDKMFDDIESSVCNLEELPIDIKDSIKEMTLNVLAVLGNACRIFDILGYVGGHEKQ